MDSEKKAPPTVFQESEKATAKSNKKYIIAAVAVVLILVITLGAVIVTLKLTNRFAADTIKEYRLAKKAVVKIDKENDMTEFEDPEMGYSAYNDFSMGLTMMKVVSNESYVCFINTLSRDSLSPEALESYIEHHPDGEDLTSQKKNVDLPEYMPAKEEISDRRFLSEHLRETCEGFPIHWLVPAQYDDLNKNTQNSTERQKRQLSWPRPLPWPRPTWPPWPPWPPWPRPTWPPWPRPTWPPRPPGPCCPFCHFCCPCCRRCHWIK